MMCICAEKFCLSNRITTSINTREGGSDWEFISENLNAIKEISLNVNKRSVRDRLNFPVENFKKKVWAEEKASGIEVEESEIDHLLLEIVEKLEEAKESIDKATAERNETAKAEHSAAQEQRQRAIESLGGNK